MTLHWSELTAGSLTVRYTSCQSNRTRTETWFPTTGENKGTGLDNNPGVRSEDEDEDAESSSSPTLERVYQHASLSLYYTRMRLLTFDLNVLNLD